MFKVKAKRREGFKGFWRDGIFWPDTEVEVESVSSAVLNEPMLIVKEVEVKEDVVEMEVSLEEVAAEESEDRESYSELSEDVPTPKIDVETWDDSPEELPVKKGKK